MGPFEARQSLAIVLAQACGYRVYERWTESPEPPCLILDWDEPVAEYDVSMGNGLNKFNFIAKVITGKLDDDGSQQTLDALIDTSGEKSLKNALQTTLITDPTLGGSISSARIVNVTNFGATTIGGNNMISASFHIVVYGS